MMGADKFMTVPDMLEAMSTTTPATVSVTTFALSMAALFVVTLLGTVTMMLLIQLLCTRTSERK